MFTLGDWGDCGSLTSSLLLMKPAVCEVCDHVEAWELCEGAVFAPQDEVGSVK